MVVVSVDMVSLAWEKYNTVKEKMPEELRAKSCLSFYAYLDIHPSKNILRPTQHGFFKLTEEAYNRLHLFLGPNGEALLWMWAINQ